MSFIFIGASVSFIGYQHLKSRYFPPAEEYETLGSMSEFNKRKLEQLGNASPIRRNDSEFSLGLNKYDMEIPPGEFCKEGQIVFVALKYIAVGTVLTYGGAFLAQKFMK